MASPLYGFEGGSRERSCRRMSYRRPDRRREAFHFPAAIHLSERGLLETGKRSCFPISPCLAFHQTTQRTLTNAVPQVCTTLLHVDMDVQFPLPSSHQLRISVALCRFLRGPLEGPV